MFVALGIRKLNTGGRGAQAYSCRPRRAPRSVHPRGNRKGRGLARPFRVPGASALVPSGVARGSAPSGTPPRKPLPARCTAMVRDDQR